MDLVVARFNNDAAQPRGPLAARGQARNGREGMSIESLLANLRAFHELQPGWDSYGALAPNPRAVDAAERVLRVIYRMGLAVPDCVVPTNRGGVVIEWPAGNCDIAVDAEKPGEARCVFDLVDPEDTEGAGPFMLLLTQITLGMIETPQ